MKAALGISTLLDADAAGREAAERAASRLGSAPPDLTVVLATSAHGRGLPRVVTAAREVVAGPLAGGSVEGIVAAGVEVSSNPAVLALAVSGGDPQPFLVEDAAGDEQGAGQAIADHVGAVREGDLVVVLADSLSVDAHRLAMGLPPGLEGATLVGGGAAPVARGRPLLWSGTRLASDALAGWVIRDAAPRISLAQAGRAVTEPMSVTRARGHWLLGLEGRPALDVYREVARSRGLADWTESAPRLLAGLLEPTAGSDGGAVAVRNVVGFDPDRGALSLPTPLCSGQRLVWMELDPVAAREDLEQGLAAAAAGGDPELGFYLNCRARGAALFGEAGVEATCLANAFANFPIAGLSGPFQIAPPAAGLPPAVLTYASALTLIGGAIGGAPRPS